MLRIFTNALGRGALFTVGSIVTRSISIITLPYFTRVLTQDEYGTVTLFISSISILSVVIGIGLPSTVANGKVEFRDCFNEYCESIQVTSIFIGLILASAIGLLFKVSGLVVFRNEILLLGVFYATALTSYNIEMEYLKFAKNVRTFLLYAISSATASAGGSIFIIEKFPEYDPMLVRIIGLVLPTILISIFLFVRRLKRIISANFINYTKFGLSLGHPMILHGLAIIVLLQSDRWFLAHFSTLESVALFSLAASVVSLLAVVSNSVSQVYKPWFYTNYKNGNDIEVEYFHKLIILIILFSVLVIILFAPEIIKIFAPISYYNSLFIVPILSVGFYAQFLYNLSTNYSNINKANNQIAIGTVVAVVFNLFCNWILINWDIYGVSLATMLSFIFLFTVQFKVAIKFDIQDSFPLVFALKSFFVLLIACIITYLGLDSFFVRIASALILVIVIILYFIYYEDNSILSSAVSSYKRKR